MMVVNYPEQGLLNRNSKLSFVSLPATFLCGGRERGLVLWDSAKRTPVAVPESLLLSQLPTSLSQSLEQALWLYKLSLFPLLASSLTGTGPEVQQGFSVNTLQGCWKHNCPHRGWAASPVSASPSFPSLPVPSPNKDEKKLL